MEDRTGYSSGGNEYDVIDIDVHSGQSSIQLEGSGIHQQPNGQCVLAVSSSSVSSPSFDLAIGRAQLERRGFEIPVTDFEIPLQTALGLPSVRRYLLFSSSLSHFIMAMVVYVVLWCGIYSTLHLYLTLTDFWLLCFSVTLASVVVTSAIALGFQYSSKQAQPPQSLKLISTDVRLIQVNERLSRHELLVGVADCSRNCVSIQQLVGVYWDLSPCLSSLTDTLEEMTFNGDEVQRKLCKNMSHLLLVTEARGLDLEDPNNEDRAEEERPLLVESRKRSCSTQSSQREETKVTKDFSLVPDTSLPTQVIAYRLLLTYSAAYVKLLASNRLPRLSPSRCAPGGPHCTGTSQCLCQYVCAKVLT
ncbi:transmembrane protein C9orf91 homolog [Arapaima gigas]